MIKILCFNKEYITGDLPDIELLLQSVKKFDVSSDNELSKRRIETGFEVTDHSYIKPKKISMSGIVGDVNKRPSTLIGSFGIPTIGWTISKTYIEDLKKNMERIRNDKLFVVIYNTKDGKYYENYLLEKLNISDSYVSKHGFEYSMTFQEVMISQIGEIITSISSNAPAQNGSKGQGGASNSKNGNVSLLKNGVRYLKEKINFIGG